MKIILRIRMPRGLRARPTESGRRILRTGPVPADLPLLPAIERRVDMLEHLLTDHLRLMQTELLRGLEKYTKGSSARIDRLEENAAQTTERLMALERKLRELEEKIARLDSL